MKNLVVLTGAGISAESGLKTFRDADGLWEGHDVMDVATPEAWQKNQELVLKFYNDRRKQALSAQPNKAHLGLAALEKDYNVTIITQNVDNLHEKAGSSKVIHLHGELFKSQSTVDPRLQYEIEGSELNLGQYCAKGSQLRPFIVWFGEMVPMMETAIHEVARADIFAVVGTSLLVYPAASLIGYTKADIPKYIIDVKIPDISIKNNFIPIEDKASTGIATFIQMIT
ncbi:SIR2 family NAD-dependent protein deacylase [Anditalea andensis]|uniref:SIR2 family NAD-dependent protein deacylase n=1 Tax=Anditalea andensis TaxID=1048983 RepID=UPI0005583510|nr:NAD-dependent deacylase [Anditalea andensis]